MFNVNDLPSHEQLTEMERLAAGAALLAYGLAYQHGDNVKAADGLADKIFTQITGQHELRQEAEKMRREKSGRHAFAEGQVSGTLGT